MKRIMEVSLLLLAISVSTNAQNKKATASHVGSAVFSGHVDGQYSANDSVYFYFTRDFLKNITRVDAEMKKVPIDGEGNFTFKLTELEQPGKLSIYFMGKASGTLGDYIIEPGDAVRLLVKLKEDEFTVAFSGKGAGKYQARQKVEIERNRFNAIRDSLGALQQELKIEFLFDLHKSAATAMSAALEKYKSQIHPETYQFMRGEFVTYPIRIWYITLANMIKKDSDKTLFLKYLSDLNMTGNAAEQESLAQSDNYVVSRIEKEKSKLRIQKAEVQGDFKTIYYDLKNEYTGVLREHLLASHLLQTYNHTNIQFSSTSDYEDCLKDAYSIVKTPAIKELLGKSIRLYSKGSDVYNFSLPDTTGKVRLLSDFKGKVIMLDMWNTGCTGCAIFADYFKRKVYPEFKDNPDFTVISINKDKSRDKWMNSLYSGKYTQPQHVNLNAGDDNEEPFTNYYSVTAYPFLLLIDKEGKLIAPLSVHTMTDLNRLISQALNNN